MASLDAENWNYGDDCLDSIFRVEWMNGRMDGWDFLNIQGRACLFISYQDQCVIGVQEDPILS